MARILALVFLVCVNCVTTEPAPVLEKYSHGPPRWQRADGTIEKNPIESDLRSVCNGQSLFQKNCAVCHGVMGKGDGPRSRDLDPRPANLVEVAGQRSDYDIYLQITMGRDGMAIWKEAIAEKDRWNIVNFMRSWSRKVPGKCSEKSEI